MKTRKTDREECAGCGRPVKGDTGQCPECGGFLNRGRLLRWLGLAVVVLAAVTYLVVSAGA